MRLSRSDKTATTLRLALLASSVVILSAAAASHNAVPTARAALDDGFGTIGGREAWRELRALRFAFATTTFAFGQEEWPGAPPAAGNSTDGTEIRDYARPGIWSRYHIANSTPSFTRVFLRDSAAFMFDTNYTGFGGGTPAEGYGALWRDDPIRLLRLAADAPDDRLRALGRGQRAGRPASGVSVVLPQDTVEIWFDAVSKQPLTVDRVEDDAVFGTRRTQMVVSAWAAAGPIRVPTSIMTMTNGQLTQSTRIQNLLVNPSSDSVFNAVRKTAATPVAAALRIVELAPGIHRVEAASRGVPYNVVFAQLGDSIIIIDPPIDDAYTKRVLDTIKTAFPKTPVRAFVVTHHHSDHLGGARAAFAAGLRAIAPAEIAEYVRDVGSEGRKVPSRKVVSVVDTLAVGTGPSRFVLYHVPTAHARGLLMAYFPEPKLLAEVDLAAGPLTDRRDLFDMIERRGLQVDQLARMHGAVLSWTNFVASIPGARPKK